MGGTGRAETVPTSYRLKFLLPSEYMELASMNAVLTKSPPDTKAASSCQNAAPPGVIRDVPAATAICCTTGSMISDPPPAAAVHSGHADDRAAAIGTARLRVGASRKRITDAC